ncbi:methyl-accepting chemotaxis protein [Pseudomarimonas salicorniae]|uniref:Methyl-accepting chemotaxis protein n=1 Tax=Pseudomarimonas salicorniae TaxID=2933270 RepID=A0ABT0GFP4_9GAMM|nr:methyl-accepting chemotaxis protein [Lysobacter sp. CAU 1642]MCK7593361.1 methyl-accepting chemotaxis protein [Lysobacter sp. CAU 1642]
MFENWTVGRRIAAGFIAVTVLLVVLGVLATVTLVETSERKDHIINVVMRNQLRAETLNREFGDAATAVRAYLLTGRARMDALAGESRAAFERTHGELERAVDTDRGRAFVARARELHGQLWQALDAMQDELAGQELAPAAVIERFDRDIGPLAEAWQEAFLGYRDFLEQRSRNEQELTSNEVDSARLRFILLLLAAVGASILISWLLTRYVAGRVGSAIAQIQTSAAELQAAANEQATSSREQTTAMNEVSTTLKELVATARQMAESTQRVSRIADETAKAARAGDATVSSANTAFDSVQRQVNLIVSHMVELGKKSHQIGAIQELINELAEQTNILSINATIESAGAGEAGRRFAVVAEEIRKLADRVSASGREIRTLVDEIRSAANTTVMVTEDGSKAVDAGMRSFSEVTSALSEIRRMVDSASETSRQIELGTRQQVTAVEQVNLTLADLAQAAKEADAGTRQTLESVDYLNKLALDLVRMTRSAA